MKTQEEAIEKIRGFLSEELMKDWALSIPLTESFELDSIDQIDLRLFLEEMFSVKFAEGQKPFQNINDILEYVIPNSQITQTC